jgi:hypothetical protein
MTDRPSDVPAAMRAAFSSKRVCDAWSMMALGQGADRLAAIGGFERLLQTHGLTLEDVRETILSIRMPSPASDPVPIKVTNVVTATAAPRGFSPVPPSAIPPEALRRPAFSPGGIQGDGRRLVGGPQIPGRVAGRVCLHHRRPTRVGEELSFSVEDDATIWGPISAFSDPQIAHLVESAASGATIALALEPTQSARIPPKVRRIES